MRESDHTMIWTMKLSEKYYFGTRAIVPTMLSLKSFCRISQHIYLNYERQGLFELLTADIGG